MSSFEEVPNKGEVLVVPNVAALTGPTVDSVPASELKEGELVFVTSLRCYWRFSPQQSQFEDLITVANNSVGGQFLRDESYHDIKWLEQQKWFLHGSAGNDENDGQTSLTPIKTWSELVRRLGMPYAIPDEAELVVITVMATPVDELQWEVVATGSASDNKAVVIKRTGTSDTQSVTGSFPLPANGEIGDMVAPAGFIDASKIYSFPTKGTDVYTCVSEVRDPTHGSFCSMVKRTGGVIENEESLTLMAEQVRATVPLQSGITYLKASPGSIILQEIGLLEAKLVGVTAIGCKISGCETTDLSAYGCLIEAGKHQGVHVATATRHASDDSGPALLLGTNYIGEENAFSVVGEVALMGPTLIRKCAVTERTSAQVASRVELFQGAFAGDSIFGGFTTGAAPVPAIGSFRLSAGGVIVTRDPTSHIALNIANTLMFDQATPVCQNSGTGVVSPAPNNLAASPFPSSAWSAPFGGTLVEAKSGGRVVDLGA